jgi:hypothetical protein
MKKLEDLLKGQQELFDGAKYVTREYQDFGYRLALKLDDLEHKALYIKLAKEEPRGILEQALSFAIDYPEARNKARIFMWKLKELREEREKKKSKHEDGETAGKEAEENGKLNSDGSGPDKPQPDNENNE